MNINIWRNKQYLFEVMKIQIVMKWYGVIAMAQQVCEVQQDQWHHMNYPLSTYHVV